jgi:casein kinase 1
MSINTHLLHVHFRRDDIESLGYVLVYFLRGSLPWWRTDSAENNDMPAWNWEDYEDTEYNRLVGTKISVSPEELCQGLPDEFATYLRYCRELEFDERPDYSYLRGLFQKLFYREGFGYDDVFDWTSKLRLPPGPARIDWTRNAKTI